MSTETATCRHVVGFAPGSGGLRADQRGAVMVVGVFMAAFLVGSLWYIIGIGDAILYRQRMQDGADAVAFAAAVYHARGMNIIAMINIIMAAILAILVAFKLVQLMNTIAMAISCALSWTGVGAAICSFTTGLSPWINKAVQIAEKLVNTTLPVLSKTQVGIAVAMPWVAQGKAAYIASTQYTEPVKGGGFVSVSLVPFVPKERLGLPVEEDEFSFLCEKAGTYVGELVFSPFGKFGGWVAGVIGSIVSTFPGYFCGESGGWGSGGSGSVSQGVSQAAIDAFAKEACEEKGKGKSNFDMDECLEDAKKDVEEDLKKQSASQSGVDGNGKTPKKVFWAAKNGNGYFQIWSVLVGNDEWPKKAEKGVQIAAWNKSMTMPDAPWGKVAFAQAEFYYDESGAWDDYKEDAMWNMFWRARLRRVRTPAPTFASMIWDEVFSVITGKLDPAVAGALGGSEIGGWLLGQMAGSAFEEVVGKVHAGGGPWEGQFIKNPNLANSAKIEIIH
jgi:hypothetical protein